MQFAETPSTQKMLRVNTQHSSMAGNQLFSSGCFPDVAFEDQTHWTRSVCAEFLNSPGLLPQNHRAEIKGSLKEELNCKKNSWLQACYSSTTSFRPPSGSFLVSCMAWMCCRCVCDTALHVATANSWGLKAFFVYTNFKSGLSFVSPKRQNSRSRDPYSQNKNLWVNFSNFKLSLNSLMDSRSHP